MGDNLSDSEQTIEKPVKTKRTYVMTEARKAAFERCRKAREEQVTRIQKEKKLKNIETKEEKLQKIKAELVIEDSEPEVEAPTLARAPVGARHKCAPPTPPPTPKATVTRPKRTRKPKAPAISKEEEQLDWHAATLREHSECPQTQSNQQYHVFL